MKLKTMKLNGAGLAVAIVLAASPALAVEDYDACVALVERDPARAEIEAGRWIAAGGGTPARHCRALALFAQGAERRAAGLLAEIAAEDRTLPGQVRAEMLVQAGEIHLGLADLAAARAAVERAMRVATDPRPVLVLSARLEAEAGNWQAAASALDHALARGEPDAEILVLRAAARQRLGQLVAARADLAWAEELAPDLPELWLEKGAVEAASGNRDAARAAWLKAIELDRDGPVAEAARLRLQRMEADLDATAR